MANAFPVLALDLSTNTGWALIDPAEPTKLKGYGNFVSKETGQPYPFSFIDRAKVIAYKLAEYLESQVLSELVVVIEEVNMSRARHSQKQLDFIHYAVLEVLARNGVHTVYVDTSQWRKRCGITLTKEQRKLNQTLAKASRESTKKGVKLDKKALGIKGKITKKHLAVNKANEIFGTKFVVKDNDIAEAALLGYAWILGVPVSTP
jgi:hypothetical protein